MANIFASIAAVLLAVSAYVAYQNQVDFEKEVSDSKTAKSQLDTNRRKLVDLRDERDRVFMERTANEAQFAQKVLELEELELGEQQLTQKVAAARSEVEDADARLVQLGKAQKIQAQNRQLIQRLHRVRGDVSDLADTVAGTEAELKEELANLVSTKEEMDSSISRYKQIERSFSKETSYFEDARIRAIYPNWGFVTLDSGHRDGVVTNSTLAIIRDGDVIANLRVRAVESQGASAELIPGSLAEGTTLMVGDQVVPVGVDDGSEADVSSAPEKPEPEPAPEITPDVEVDEDIDFGF